MKPYFFEKQAATRQARYDDLRAVERKAATDMRRRAIIDAIAMIGLILIAASLGVSDHIKLLLALGAAGFSLIFYIIRRNQDFRRLARASRWRETVTEGRGIRLEDWIAGAELQTWEERAIAPLPQERKSEK